MTSTYYEEAAKTLSGDKKERALRAAQNHLQADSSTYMADFKRLHAQLIAAMTQQVTA